LLKALGGSWWALKLLEIGHFLFLFQHPVSSLVFDNQTKLQRNVITKSNGLYFAGILSRFRLEELAEKIESNVTCAAQVFYNKKML